MTTGSSGNARAAVVLAAGDDQWEATAESSGAIGALYLAAIRRLLAGEAWAVATEAAGNARLAELRARAERAGGRAELDESQAERAGGRAELDESQAEDLGGSLFYR